jgi:hypothetical protein
VKKPFLVCRGKTFFSAGKRAPVKIKINSMLVVEKKKPFLICRGKTF